MFLMALVLVVPPRPRSVATGDGEGGAWGGGMAATVLGLNLLAAADGALTLGVAQVLGLGGRGNGFIAVAFAVVGAVFGANLGRVLRRVVSESRRVTVIVLAGGAQLILSGLLVPTAGLPEPLGSLARFLPLSNAAEGLRSVVLSGKSSGSQLLAVALYGCAALVLSTWVSERKSALAVARSTTTASAARAGATGEQW
jgi:hypothetical protein